MVLDSQNLDMELINQDLEWVHMLSLALACMDHIKLCHLCMDHMLLLMEDLLLDHIMEDIHIIKNKIKFDVYCLLLN
jgi:hypothetical protein